jgi:hypothetical protein
MLILIAWLGLRRFHREGHAEASAGWLLLLGGSPLLAMSIGWGYMEVPVALLLLGIWLRWRSGSDLKADRPANTRRRSPIAAAGGAAVDGIMAAVLTLLRLDLFWIPIAWWLAKRRHAGWRVAAIGLTVWLLMLAPWVVRNVHLTGEPFFSLQAYGEHLKQTPEWPAYAIYRSLEPEAFWTTMTQRPGIVLVKSVSGLRFFLTQLGRWLPWIAWGACLLLLARAWRSRGRSNVRNRFWQTELALPLLTMALLLLQYAVFSHTLRHLLVLLPIVTWEVCLACSNCLREWRPGWQWLRRAGLLTTLFLAALILTPSRLPGWENARQHAELSAGVIADAAADLQRQPGGPLFTDSAALLWLSDRAGVWSPLNREVEAEIRRRVPNMARAPLIRLLEPMSDQDLKQETLDEPAGDAPPRPGR